MLVVHVRVRQTIHSGCSYQRMYWPQSYHIVQEISVHEQKEETRLRRIRRRKFIRDKLSIKPLLRKRRSTFPSNIFFATFTDQSQTSPLIPPQTRATLSRRQRVAATCSSRWGWHLFLNCH